MYYYAEMELRGHRWKYAESSGGEVIAGVQPKMWLGFEGHRLFRIVFLIRTAYNIDGKSD